jgi:hypothetical protein
LRVLDLLRHDTSGTIYTSSVCLLPSECENVILLLRVFIYLWMGWIFLRLLSFERLSTVTPWQAYIHSNFCPVTPWQAYIHSSNLNVVFIFSTSYVWVCIGIASVRKVVCIRACVCVCLFVCLFVLLIGAIEVQI